MADRAERTLFDPPDEPEDAWLDEDTRVWPRLDVDPFGWVRPAELAPVEGEDAVTCHSGTPGQPMHGSCSISVRASPEAMTAAWWREVAGRRGVVIVLRLVTWPDHRGTLLGRWEPDDAHIITIERPMPPRVYVRTPDGGLLAAFSGEVAPDGTPIVMVADASWNAWKRRFIEGRK